MFCRRDSNHIDTAIDIVIMCSISSKEVIFGELAVLWEDNIDDAYARKLAKYAELETECNDRG